MKLIITIFKWILIIIFFPMSLIFVGYYKQKKDRKELKEREDEELLQQESN